MKYLAWVLVLLFNISLLADVPVFPDAPSVRSSYADALEKLALVYRRSIGDRQRRVMIGEFPCANVGQEGLSTMSRIIQDRLAEACSDHPQFRLIARDHLEKLLMERKLQSSDLVDPQTITKIQVEGVDGLIHGSYVYAKPWIMLSLNLTLLDGGRKITVTSEIPVSLIGSDNVLPPAEQTAVVVDTFLHPANRDRRKQNLDRVRERVKELPQRGGIRADVWVEGARDHFVGGELVRYRLRVDRDCFVALLCHQLDGSIVQLFPNPHNRENRLMSDIPITVPGDRSGFQIRIGPPYGGDVVQIIACNDQETLQALVDAWLAGKSFKRLDNPKVLWGEQHLLVNTHPRDAE